MKRRLISLLLALCLLVGLLPVTTLAASSSDLTFKLNSDGKSYSVSRCSSLANGFLTIPANYNSLPVTTIDSSAFAFCNELLGVKIPDTVTEIGSSAFYECGSLQVNIPAGVTSIGDWAFHGCGGIRTMTIPEGMTGIGEGVFDGCHFMTAVTIPASITSIGNEAFAGCDGLTDVHYGGTQEQWEKISVGTDNVALQNATIHYADAEDPVLDYLTFALNEDGESYSVTDCDTYVSGELAIPATYNGKPVISIGASAFRDCASLTGITIPDSITSIGDWAFYKCTGLTGITIPNSVITIGDYAFYKCAVLIKITIPDSVTAFGSYAFSDCTSLTTVNIGDGVTGIGYNTFAGCTDLTNVTIGNRVSEIGVFAFASCTSLTSITIPDSVTTINNYVFQNCNGLADVYYGGTQEQWGQMLVGAGNDPLLNATLHTHTHDYIVTIVPPTVTEQGYTEYRCYCGKSCKDSVVSALLTFILNSDGASYCVTDCDTSVSGELVIPAAYEGKPVTGVGDYAFYNCTSLTVITIPNSVTSIGDGAFTFCDFLISIIIPDSVTNIGDDAFSYCKSLTSITIPNSVTSVGDDAFSRCDSLTSITIPDSITSIGDDAFSYCKSLTSITIPNSVTSIGDDAFYNCANLTGITIPDSVTSIGNYAFSWCDSLTDVYYDGTEEQWEQISFGNDNDPLLNATIHFKEPEAPIIPEEPEEPENPDVLPGDVNGDGVVNLKDATVLRRYAAGWPDVEIDLAVADVNGDGKVNLKDATILRRYAAGWPGVELS